MNNFIKRISELKAELEKTDEEVLIETTKGEPIYGKLKEVGEDYFTIEQKEKEKIIYIRNVIAIQKKTYPQKSDLGVFKGI